MKTAPLSTGPMILAISGSLRRSSLNSAALRAVARVAARRRIPLEIDVSIRALPQFDPDLESEPPHSVQCFRKACEAADAFLLAVPEYAFGIPGAFKNALDWTVGSGSIYRKPVALLSVAPTGRGGNVRHALELVFTALDCDVSYHSVGIAHADLDQDFELRDPAITEELARVLEALAVRARVQSDGAQPPLRVLRHT